MRSNKTLRRVVTAVLAVVVLCGTAFAASTVTTKTLQANYMGIKLVVDGVQIDPKDANGNSTEPFACDGSTYLPVRAIADALGKKVTWDGDTRTVYVGEVPGQTEDWMTKLPPYKVTGNKSKIYDGSDLRESFTMAGVTHTTGVVLGGVGANAASALWNTNSLYKTMTITIGYMSSTTQKNSTLEVYLDGVFLTDYALKWDGAPQTIEIPLNYAPNVRLALNNRYGSYSSGDFTAIYGICDISFS